MKPTSVNQRTRGSAAPLQYNLSVIATTQIAAGNSHRPFSFDRDMKFEHHHSLLAWPPGGCA
jgi:hypothetical protein